MDIAVILFGASLLLAGLICILLFKRGITESICDERRQSLDEWNALMIQKQRMERRRRVAWTMMEAAYIKFNQKTRDLDKLAEAKSERHRRPDPWSNFSTSNINSAFEKFMLGKPQKAMHAHAAAAFQSNRQHQQSV